MNQRLGKKHAAGARDNSDKIDVRLLLEFIRAARKDLASVGEAEAEFRFSMMEDFITEDYLNGKPFIYQRKSLGI